MLSNEARPTARENKVARALVHPEKVTRDATFQAMQNYLITVTEMDEMQMLRLWKAFYYCMWLCDKAPVQNELAESVASLISRFQNDDLSLLYIRMFYRIMLREWSHLDHYRLNKFYTLIRLMTRKALKMAYDKRSTGSFLQRLNEIYTEEVLVKIPNGIRFHHMDVFLSELSKATDGQLDTTFFMATLEPFFHILATLPEKIVFEKILSMVFDRFLEIYAQENKAATEGEESPALLPIWDNVDTKALQAKMFETAANPTTDDRFRQRFYSLHKTISVKTGVAFVSNKPNTIANKSSVNVESEGKENKKKRKKDKEAEQEEEVEIVAEPTNNDKPKKKKKKSKTESSE